MKYEDDDDNVIMGMAAISTIRSSRPVLLCKLSLFAPTARTLTHSIVGNNLDVRGKRNGMGYG